MTIITYEERYKEDFIRLNRQWIETYFRLEESDLKTFANIDSYIIGGGGQIFLAVDEKNDEVQGCCALINHPDKDCYELAKMAVAPHAQGKHIGYELGQALLVYARRKGVKRIYLEGNTRLAASIHLYRKLGFEEVPLVNHAYERCDILMEKWL
ncbi:MAG: GNAT family N-acetyltransferase [Bacteroidaceae bacterium]|nr:GNAT family N-acetyltransferase [Bacteroidaceae bacterium]